MVDKSNASTVLRHVCLYALFSVISALWTGKSQNAVQNDFPTLPKLSTRRAPVKVEQDQITSKRKDNIKALMVCTVKQESRL